MRILHVYKTALPSSHGGVEQFIDTLCRESALLGVENTVLVLHPSPQEQPIVMNGYTLYQAKQNLFVASTGFSLAAVGMFRTLAQTADIIHYHFPNPFADLLHLLCPPRKPCIVSYHSDIVKQKYLLQLYKPLGKFFLDSVDHIVAASPNYCASSRVLQQYAHKVSIIPYGVDPSFYENYNSQRLEHWQSHLQSPFFLFVGALRYYKGLHIALEAVAGTDIKLVIAGSGGVEQELKSQAAKLGLEQQVDFLGMVNDEDKVALLHLCHGFVFPSHLRSEAFGISLLEAAAVGKPMISCEIGTGTTFVNIADETGLVITPDCPDSLREAMQYLLDNPDAAINMGIQAKQRLHHLFTAEQTAHSYLSLYQKMLAR